MKIDVISIIGHENGLFFSIEGRTEDFWMLLSPVIGWGRFSLVSNRLPDVDEVFEIVEIRRVDEFKPDNIVTFNNVVWRKREASEIMFPNAVL